MKRWAYMFRQFRVKIGPRVATYVVLAVITALAANYLGPLIPDPVTAALKDVDINSILLSIASTMLTISTFALSTTVSANSSAVSSTTPRAFRLLLQDQGTQDMLVLFLGSFAFAVTTLIINPLTVQAHGGKVIITAITVYLLIRILFNFVRWATNLRELGSMSHTLNKIEDESLASFEKYWSDPLSGCQAFLDDTVDTSALTPIYVQGGKFVQLIDEEALEAAARTYHTEIYVNFHEGDFVTQAKPLAWVKGEASDALKRSVAHAILMSKAHDLDGDGRFGLTMLEETASKALSSAINDAGTASACVQTAYRIFSAWPAFKPRKLRRPHVWKRPISLEKTMSAFFLPVAHDAGDTLSVHADIMTSLAGLSRSNIEECAEAANKVAHLCYERAMEELKSEVDQEYVRNIFRSI